MDGSGCSVAHRMRWVRDMGRDPNLTPGLGLIPELGPSSFYMMALREISNIYTEHRGIWDESWRHPHGI